MKLLGSCLLQEMVQVRVMMPELRERCHEGTHILQTQGGDAVFYV
jgi:hypothetical protein